MVFAKALSVSASADRQKITLSDGEPISARLVVLANGLNVGLRHTLGIERKIVSALPLDLDRVRPRAGRPPGLRFSGADLFLGTAERPHPLSSRCFRSETRMRGQSVRLSRVRRSLAARVAPRAGRDPERGAAAAAPDHRRLRRLPATSRSGPPISMSAPAIASPASCWSATPLRPPARSPAPAPTRCSPTSNGSATSISRPGLRPTAWATGQDRRVLRRPRQEGLRRLVDGKGL